MEKVINLIKFPFQFIWTLVIYVYYSRKFRTIDYFDYKKLANPKFIEPKGFNAVCHYGNYKAIAKLTGRRFNFITDYVEHSVNFVTDPAWMKNAGYYNRKTIRRIYVMSALNVSTYNQCIKNEKLKSKTIAVGPYILGVSHFKSQKELSAIKEKYKRILLVFPQHSIETIKSDYDKESFIKMINQCKEEYNFDTVFICLYWVDILDGSYEIYEQNGFVIVTSGHRSDPNFLRRLKDLIFLADHTMSNAIGAYIGYSVIMGKPHYMYKQQTKYVENENKNKKLSYPPSFEEAKQKIGQTFGTFTETITDEQKEIVQLYWGNW